MLDKNDLELIEAAKQVINKNFDEVNENHTVGAAITEGEREFETIVAVRSPRKNNALIPPCGNCRQLLKTYSPNIKV